MSRSLHRIATPLAGALTLALALTPPTLPALAQDAVPTEQVRFAPGTSSATITRIIKGRGMIDFRVRAKAGQQLDVAMKADNSAAYFNLLAPGESVVAFYNGSMSAPLNTYSGSVPATGEMTIRVYLYRAAARRGESAKIELTVAIDAPASASPAGSEDALVLGTEWHATGTLTCMEIGGANPTDCAFGVKRLGSGSALVEVTGTDGVKRTIHFREGRAESYETGSESGFALKQARSSDNTIVTLAEQRYVIPDAVIYGG